MPFNFNLNLCIGNCNSNSRDNEKTKSLTNRQEIFKEAVETCHSKTKNKKSFGHCMKKELKK